MSVTLRLTFCKKKLHKQGSFIFLTYFALFCNLKFYIHTYKNDMFMELFKLKVKGTTPSCIDFCPKFGNYQIFTIFCRNRTVTPISPNLKQVLVQILFHLQWIRKQMANVWQNTKYFCKISKVSPTFPPSTVHCKSKFQIFLPIWHILLTWDLLYTSISLMHL